MFDLVKDKDGLFKIWIDKATKQPMKMREDGKPLPTWDAVVATSQAKMLKKLVALKLAGKEFNFIDRTHQKEVKALAPVSEAEIERELKKFPQEQSVSLGRIPSDHQQQTPPIAYAIPNFQADSIPQPIDIPPIVVSDKFHVQSIKEIEINVKDNIMKRYVFKIMKGTKKEKAASSAEMQGFVDGVTFTHPELKESLDEFVKLYNI